MTKSKKKVSKGERRKPVVVTDSFAVVTPKGPRPPRVRIENMPPRYPFHELKVGQAIFVPAQIDTSKYKNEKEAKKAQTEECRFVSNRMSGAIRRFAIRHPELNYKLSVQIIKNAKELGLHPSKDIGVSVWREKDGK